MIPGRFKKMRFLRGHVVCLVALVLLPLGKAKAAVVVTFEPSTSRVTIPTTGTEQFSVVVRIAADTGTQAINAYEISVDLSPPVGVGRPVGWQILSVTEVTSFGGGFFDEDFITPAEGDLRVGDLTLGAPLTFTTTPTALFSFVVSVDSTAQVGQYSIGVFDGVLLDLGSLPRGQVDISNVATINVAAIPEPGALNAMLMISTVLGGAHWMSRRRRRRGLA